MTAAGGKYTTQYFYDNGGRQYKTINAGNTINQTVFDALGRPTAEQVGTTSGTPVTVRSYVYDNDGVGDENVTQIVEHPSGTANGTTDQPNRVTNNFYDWRDRPVASKSGVGVNESTTHPPISFTEYDNLGEATVVSVYDGANKTVTTSNGEPQVPSGALLVARSQNYIDNRGQTYRTQQYGVSNGNIAGGLVTNFYRDGRGQVTKETDPGGLVTKTEYDGAGRVTDQSVGSESTPVHQVHYERLETGGDNAIFSVTTDSGPAGDRVTYTGSYFDEAGRLTQSVDFGTHGGTTFTYPSGGAPRYNFDGNDEYLITDYTYDAAGNNDTITDPRGIVTKKEYDNLGRIEKQITAYTDGNPHDYSDQTIIYGYNGLDQQTSVTNLLPNGTGSPKQHTTTYVYGVIGNNDLLSVIKLPNGDSGQSGGSVSVEQSFLYNSLGEVTRKIDRGNVWHDYAYDALGRQKTDTVYKTQLDDEGIDSFIVKQETRYNAAGQAAEFLGWGADGQLKSDVSRVFNGFGQLSTETQAGSVFVNGKWTWFSGAVQYHYSSESAGQASNASRLTSIVYPNGRTLLYGYTGLDSTIGRVSFLADQSDNGSVGVHLEEYGYLGLDTVVQQNRPQPDANLSYVSQSGDTDRPTLPGTTTVRNDGGDAYGGLDRFGRVIDQRWSAAGQTSSVDRNQYAYDADSNLLYADNRLSSQWSGLYQTNDQPASLSFSSGQWISAYDPLNRLYEFRRGTLSASAGAGRLNDVATAQSATSRTYQHDSQGNLTGGSVFDSQNQPTGSGERYNLGYTQQTQLGVNRGTYEMKYDAWGRLKSATMLTDRSVVYYYDALGRRIATAENAKYGDINNGVTISTPVQMDRIAFYSTDGRVREERSSNGPAAYAQYVWSAGGGGLLLRDRNGDWNDTSGNWGKTGSGLEERLYALHDAQGSITAVTDETGAVVERYVYDGTGNIQVLDPNWGLRTAGFAPQVNNPSAASANAAERDNALGRAFSGSTVGWSFYHDGLRYARIPGVYQTSGGDYNPGQDRMLQPNYAAYAMGGNAYDPHVTLFGSETLGRHAGDIATGIRMASWSVPAMGLAVNWAGNSYQRSMAGQSNVFFGGFGDATGITSIYNGYQHGSWTEAGLGVLQLGLTALSFGQPLGFLAGHLPAGGPTMGELAAPLVENAQLMGRSFMMAGDSVGRFFRGGPMFPPPALSLVGGGTTGAAMSGGEALAGALGGGWGGNSAWGGGAFGNALFSLSRNSSALNKAITQSVGNLRSAGVKDAHHIIQDAAVRDLPGYDTNAAPGVQLDGPSTAMGTPHYNATQAQRLVGGGTYGAERRIAYNALRAAGYSNSEVTQAIEEADRYFNSIGVNQNTPTRIPGNRP